MAGNSGEDNANPGNAREVAPERPDEGDSPVLDGVSDAELDAIVGQLRTDKSLRAQPSAQPRYREATQSERLHRGAGRSRASTLGEEEAPPPKEAVPVVKHAWYFVAGGAAYGPHDLADLKAHVERGFLGIDSLCWREGFSEWLPLGHIPELASTLLPPAVPVGPPPVPPEASRGFMPQAARAVDVSEATTERVILNAPGTVVPPFAAIAPAAVVATPEVSAVAMPQTQASGASLAVEAPGAPAAGVAVGPAPEAVVATLAPEPVTAPAASDFAASGAPASDPTPVAEPVGTHAVLASPSPEERARRKRRLGFILAGGAIGGVSVALALSVLGIGGGRGAASPGEAVDTARGATGAPPPVEAPVAAAPTPEAVAAASQGAAASGASTSAGGTGSASPGLRGAGIATSAAESARDPSPVQEPTRPSTPSLSAASVERGGRVPELTGTESTARAATGGGRPSPEERVFERPTGSLSSRDVAVAFVIGKHSVAPAPEPEPAKRPATTVAEAATAGSSEDDLGPDADFDRMLSGPGPNATKHHKPTVYVPPDPTAPRESLDLATVFAVVHARRSELAACAREQSAPPQEGDRAVLRLSVLPSGKVESITTETPWLRGTSLVRCMQQKIGAWTFPRHRTQGAPVVFRYEF
ncbi:GYF domain-containing protein [Myxococcus xanthus]|nr:GYF domain-containing protein [Myxococcus xanthus]